MNSYEWYGALKKPSFAPPSRAFGIAWSILYPVIFVSFGYVFYLAATGKVSWIVAAPFVPNLVFNFAFTPLQFGLKNNALALVDVILVDATLIWAALAVWPHSKPAALAQIPYLAWVLFASALQISITFLNARKL